MREIIRSLCTKREGQIAGIRVCARTGKRFSTIARFYVREHDPKVAADDPDASIEPVWLDTESELEDAVLEELEELGNDGDADGWRVFAYNAGGQQIGSKMRYFAEEPEGEEPGNGNGKNGHTSPVELALSFMGTAIRDLAAEFPRAMRESRLTIGVLTDTLGKREDIALRAVDGMTNARIGEVQARADAEVIEMANTAQAALDAAVATAPEDETTNTTADRALDMVERFFSRLGGSAMPAGASAAAGVDWDAVADAVADDPELQSALGQKFAAAQERAAARRAAAADKPPKRGKRKRAEPEPPAAPEGEVSP